MFTYDLIDLKLLNLLPAFESAVNADAGGTLDWVNNIISDYHPCLDSFILRGAPSKLRWWDVFGRVTSLLAATLLSRTRSHSI